MLIFLHCILVYRFVYRIVAQTLFRDRCRLLTYLTERGERERDTSLKKINKNKLFKCVITIKLFFITQKESIG